MSYLYLKDAKVIDGHIQFKNPDGVTKSITVDELLSLYNDAIEAIWDYQERCHELRNELSEWITDYEQLVEHTYYE